MEAIIKSVQTESGFSMSDEATRYMLLIESKIHSDWLNIINAMAIERKNNLDLFVAEQNGRVNEPAIEEDRKVIDDLPNRPEDVIINDIVYYILSGGNNIAEMMDKHEDGHLIDAFSLIKAIRDKPFLVAAFREYIPQFPYLDDKSDYIERVVEIDDIINPKYPKYRFLTGYSEGLAKYESAIGKELEIEYITEETIKLADAENRTQVGFVDLINVLSRK